MSAKEKEEFKVLGNAEKEEPKKPKLTASMIHKRWEGSHQYKKDLGLTERWKTNDRFIAGEQWSAIPANQPQLKSLPRPVMNITKQIVNFKAASIKGENVKMIFSPFGAGSAEGEAFSEEIRDLGELLNRLTSVTWEKAKLDFICSRAVDRAAATGIGIAYFYWDKSVGSKSKESPFLGDIRAECLDAMYVGFGNPNELDVQKQPYIVVSGRADLDSLITEARKNGLPEDEIKRLNEDEPEQDKYSGAEHSNRENRKVTVYTHFWKENGNVYFAKSTQSVMLKNPAKMNLTQYPFAIFNWEERMDCIYGNDEVSSIIPNQRAINGLLAMDLMSKQLTGFPKLLVDGRYISAKQITNTVGEIIRTNSANMPIGHSPLSYIQPANQTNAVTNVIEMMMQKTKDFSGANEAVTGEANTNNASAIMLLQKSSSLPTEDIRRRYYQFIEDIGAILVDFYKGYYTNERMMQYKKSDGSYGEIEFSAKLIKDVEFTIRSDIGASSVFSDSNAVSTLDKITQLGWIDKVTYIKLIPKALAPFKEELLEIFRVEAELQKKIQAEMGIDAAGNPTSPQPQMPSIEEQMVQEISQPPEGQRTRLQEEYGSEGQ